MTSQNSKAAINVQRIENTVSSLTRLIKDGLTAEQELNASSELYTRSIQLREAKQLLEFTNREFSDYEALVRLGDTHSEAKNTVEDFRPIVAKQNEQFGEETGVRYWSK